MNAITTVTPDTLQCICGRTFVASTPARMGVTRSNAIRHGDRCAVAQVAIFEAGQKAKAQAEAAATQPTATIVPAVSFGVSDPTSSDVIAVADQAIADAKARRDAGAALIVNETSNVAKMIRVHLDVRISTDGAWLVRRNLAGEEGAGWKLFRLSDGKVGVKFVGDFATCTAAFGADGVLNGF